MKSRRVGLWLVGAFGGVGTTVTLGLAAMARKLTPETGLVSALPLFAGLDLPEAAQFVIGGHEIRSGSFLDSAHEFRKASGVFDAALIETCAEELTAASKNVRPGVVLGAGETISKLADWVAPASPRTAEQAIDQIGADLAAFVDREKIDHLIVMNVSSTEPPFRLQAVHEKWDALNAALGSSGAEILPASALYSVAALKAGHTYINFTPSLGASFPAAYQLADSSKALHAGKDGKTGETLLKTVLAPMFAQRNLQVMSWVGHNIFGNRDGLILDDPVNKASKVGSKDQVVHSILGYKPTTLVSIEYIPDMGDWKTAWDHIHFQGFLGTKMTLQFTWQGCDSLLAAPLAIDLARLADSEKQRGASGLMKHLASFFKSPEGVADNDFFEQFRLLQNHVHSASSTTRSAPARR
jgi:myo-inositol-1-phosphate synthase